MTNLLALAGMVAAASGWNPYENPFRGQRTKTTTSAFRRKRRAKNRTAKRSRAINRRQRG